MLNWRWNRLTGPLSQPLIHKSKCEALVFYIAGENVDAFYICLLLSTDKKEGQGVKVVDPNNQWRDDRDVT